MQPVSRSIQTMEAGVPMRKERFDLCSAAYICFGLTITGFSLCLGAYYWEKGTVKNDDTLTAKAIIYSLHPFDEVET